MSRGGRKRNGEMESEQEYMAKKNTVGVEIRRVIENEQKNR